MVRDRLSGWDIQPLSLFWGVRTIWAFVYRVFGMGSLNDQRELILGKIRCFPIFVVRLVRRILLQFGCALVRSREMIENQTYRFGIPSDSLIHRLFPHSLKLRMTFR
jgi:hypothetical protein